MIQEPAPQARRVGLVREHLFQDLVGHPVERGLDHAALDPKLELGGVLLLQALAALAGIAQMRPVADELLGQYGDAHAAESRRRDDGRLPGLRGLARGAAEV